jgi:arsenite-transporting ATPase
VVFLRIIIYTGKGGVGKTSISMATAIRCAQLGKRTIVMSTDAAHSLSDSIGKQVGPEPAELMPNLMGLEIDILKELEDNWGEIKKYVYALFASQGMDEISAEEMAIFPGMEFIAALFHIERFYRNEEYDVVVVDTAPTADTLRLLSFPDVADWYFQRFYGLMKNFIRVARATVGRVVSFPLPSNETLKEFERFNLRIRSARDIIVNPEVTSVRLVTNPEKMVINETMRAYTYLSLYNMTVEAVVVNKILSSSRADANKLSEQEHYLSEIEELFAPLKIFKVPQLPLEVVGIQALEKLGASLFSDAEPDAIFSKKNPMRIVTGKNTYISLHLPFASGSKVDLYRTRDSLILTIGQYRRTIALPVGLYSREVESAEMHGDELIIKFKGEKYGRRK